jgi:hypothetical protein
MLFQLLSPKSAEDAMPEVAKDPHNQQAITILCLAILPLGLQFLNGNDPLWMIAMAAVIAGFALALWLIATGIQARKDFDAATAAPARKLPRKIVGSIVMGLPVMALVLLRDGPAAQAAVYGVLATALSLLAFGLDPLRAKGLDTVQDRDQYRAGTISEASRSRMRAMKARIATLQDSELDALMGGFEAVLDRMLDIMQDDPARMRALRVHLGIYMDGAEEATTRFVALYRGTQDPSARADYMMLLCDLADEFEARGTQYAMDGKSKLDVQIDVLRSKMGKSVA